MKALFFAGILFALLSLLPLTHAATISGIIYDGLTLESQPDAVVSVYTNPVQTKVSKDGLYAFDVPLGIYTLEATYSENGVIVSRAEQKVVITKEGIFGIDLILLPDIGDVPNEPIPDETGISILDQIIQGPLGWWILLGVVLMGVGYAVVQRKTFTRTPKNSETGLSGETGMAGESNAPPKKDEIQLDKYALEMMGHLKRGGNRLTQKDLRGMVNIGEAKVSLVVSELESYDFIKKIKRGRGNILILTDKGRVFLEKEEKNNVKSLPEQHPENENPTSE